MEEVTVSLHGIQDTVLVARSDGVLAGDVRPLVRLDVSVIVNAKGQRESGSSGGGGRYAYGYFQDEDRALTYASEAVRQALLKLDAVAAPAGPCPWSWAPAGRVCCFMRQWATVLRAISIARAPPLLPSVWVSRSRHRCAPS